MLLTAAHFLSVVLAPTLKMAVWALVGRLLLFDPLLNLSAGDKVFAVGQIAAVIRCFAVAGPAWAGSPSGLGRP